MLSMKQETLGISYNELVLAFHKGLRNGNWRRLAKIKKGFIRAVIWYTRFRRKIINPQLVAMVLDIVKELTSTVGAQLIQAGRAKAQEMLLQYEEKGTFEWFPQFRKWLREPGYIFWLGTIQIYNSWLLR